MNKNNKVSNENLNLLVDNHPNPMVLSDLNGIILAINDKLAIILGKSKEELMGSSGFKHIGKHVVKNRKRAIDTVIKTKKPFSFEDKDRGRWWFTEIQPVFDKDGNVVKLATYIKDITKKKEIESNLEITGDKLDDITEKYILIADHMTDFVFQTTLTGKFTFTNPVCERYGYKQDEMIGSFFTKYVPKREIPKYFAQIKKMISGEKIDSYESFIIHNDGHLIPVEFSGQMVKIGKKRYINGIMRNISKRKKAEEERERINRRYKLLLENTGCPVTYINKNGKVILINELGAKNLGGKPKDFLEKSIYDLIPDFAEENKKRFSDIIKSGKGQIHEDIFELPSGTKWFLSDLQPVLDDKKVVGIQIFSIDITNQKKTEISLRESEEKFRTLFEKAPYGIYLHDENGVFIDGNKTAENMIGYKKGELIGKNFMNLNLIPKEELKEFRPNRHLSINSPPFGPRDLTLIRKNNTKLQVEVRSHPIMIDNKLVTIGFVNDVSEIRKYQRSLIETKNYLQRIIDNASELIFTIDNNLNVKTWNRTAAILTEFKSKEIIGKNVNRLDVFANMKDLLEYIHNVINGNNIPFNELILNRKSGGKILVKISSSIINDDDGKPEGILFTGKDVTQEFEVHSRLIPGNSYIILDNKIESAQKLFISLTSSNGTGLYITRDNPSISKNKLLFDSNVEILLMQKEPIKGYKNISNPDEFVESIKDFIKKTSKSIILFDRLDYFITLYSFEKILKCLYDINQAVIKNNSILLLRLNPSILDEKQISFLKEEFSLLPSQKLEDVELDRKLYHILVYIYTQNKYNMRVTYNKIGSEFNISKVTTGNYLKKLEDQGLIFIKKLGRSKTLYTSEKGKILLNKRNSL